jgi:flavin reductase (DIM6/NTAB) family NADH-FMN oxidoreductase RutF
MGETQPPRPEHDEPPGGPPEAFSVLSYFWTPLVAVGCSRGDRLNAQISVSTLGASIVPDRPRLLSVLYKANFTHELVTEKGSFSTCLLAQDQTGLIPKLGFVSGRDEDKMAGLNVDVTSKGNPILKGCLAWLECEVIDTFDLGDASCFLAAVTATDRLRAGDPISWAGIRSILSPEVLAQWDRKIVKDILRYRQLMRWLSDR